MPRTPALPKLLRSLRAGLLATAAAGLLTGCLLADVVRLRTAQAGAPHRVEGTLPLELPFRQTAGGLMLVPVTVGNGQGTAVLDFVLDTGAPVTVLLDVPAAAPLKLDLEDARHLGDPDEPASPVGAFRWGYSLDFGKLTLAEMPVVGIQPRSMPCPDRVADVGMQGVIGRDLFRRFVVEMDFDRKVMRLHDPAAYRYDAATTVVPFEEAEGHVFVRGTALLADGRQAEGLVHVDTGSNGAIDVLARADLPAPTDAKTRQICQVNGLIEVREAGPSTVRLGGAETPDVPATFVPGRKPMTEGHVARAGMKLLGRHNLVIDYPGKRLGFRARAAT